MYLLVGGLLFLAGYTAVGISTRYVESAPPQDVVNARLSGIDGFTVTLDPIERGKITEAYPRLDIRRALANGFDEVRYRGRVYKYVPGANGVLSLADDGETDRYLVSEVHERLDDEKWSRATRIVVTDRETGEAVAKRVWWKQVGSTWHPRNSTGSHWEFLLSVLNPPPRERREYQLVPVTISEVPAGEFAYRDVAERSRIQGCRDEVQLHSTEFKERWIETESWMFGHWRGTYRIEQVFCHEDSIFLVLNTIGVKSLHIEWLSDKGELLGYFFISLPGDVASGRRSGNWVDSVDVTAGRISFRQRFERRTMENLPPEDRFTAVRIDIDTSLIDGDAPARNENYVSSTNLKTSFNQ